MDDFQTGVGHWMAECFPPEARKDHVERCDRFIEEALELTQACGYGADRAHALVDYVYSRPKGDQRQEVGGTMVTLAALCNTFAIDIGFEARRELARIGGPDAMAKIRAKHAAKPTGSALPVALPADVNGGDATEIVARALFEAEEDETDEICSWNKSSADFIGPRGRWDDAVNKPVHDGFRKRARHLLRRLPVGVRVAIEKPQNLTLTVPVPLPVRAEVALFALLMERELQANEHKGGWKDDKPQDLAYRLFEEACKAHTATDLLVHEGVRNLDANRAAVVREAADTANMAMMVADVVGGLREPLASIGEQP